MIVEDLIRAGDLVGQLEGYIETQTDILEGIKKSLEEYQEFLIKEMEKNRDLRTTINESSFKRVLKIPVRIEA